MSWSSLHAAVFINYAWQSQKEYRNKGQELE